MSLLEQAIARAESELSAVNLKIQSNPAAARATPDLKLLLAEILTLAEQLEPARMLVHARDESALRLDYLRAEATRSLASARGALYVTEGGRDIRFEVVRLLAVQAHLASSWSLYDTLWSGLRRLLLPHHVLADRSKSPTLLSACINAKKSQSGRLGEMLTQLHGWSIGASYYIRNRFLHDGGSALLPNLFDGQDVGSEYRIASAFLDEIRQRCQASDWGLAERMTWRSRTWPTSNDLKVILDECHADTDEAFRRMLAWALDAANGIDRAVLGAGT